jgi:Family of unknown function (DUF5947)
MTSFAKLRSLIRKPGASDLCALCGASLSQEHRHVVEVAFRRLICTCDACEALFYQYGETKYKSVPRNSRFLQDFQLSDSQWDDLMIPIGLAFFLNSSTEGKVLAFYPSPAGATESMLSLESWAEIIAGNHVVAGMEPDVEALLANRLDRPAEYYLVPIDQCYKLIGLIRTNWHGLSGGAEMWTKTREFFTELKESTGA